MNVIAVEKTAFNIVGTMPYHAGTGYIHACIILLTTIPYNIHDILLYDKCLYYNQAYLYIVYCQRRNLVKMIAEFVPVIVSLVCPMEEVKVSNIMV